jgi:hypothetical protein
MASTGGDLEYKPTDPLEWKYYQYLWDVAHKRPQPGQGDPVVSSQGELSGLDAVTFFMRSNVDKGFLKQIWTMSTSGASMNMFQFFVALRFITMLQNGEIPINKGE